MEAAAEQRKELAILFKQADEKKPLGNRRIAKALNVVGKTIDRDVAATNVATLDEKPNENNVANPEAATNVATSLAGEAAAALVRKRGDRHSADDRRNLRLTEIVRANRALPTGIRYPIVYTDPPWRLRAFIGPPSRPRSASGPVAPAPLDQARYG
jgi:hypothetical protein